MRTILSCLFSVCVAASCLGDADYTNSPAYRAVLDAHYILIEGEGTVEVPFRAARELFESDRILDLVQESYADMLPEGETPEFTVEAEGSNTWAYVNREGETSRIVELHRTFAGDGLGRLVYYAEGERFFGNFRAVIDIRVREAAPAASAYIVTVSAYPENALSRFFARHFGIAERYFNRKTRDITALSAAISRHLLADAADSQLVREEPEKRQDEGHEPGRDMHKAREG